MPKLLLSLFFVVVGSQNTKLPNDRRLLFNFVYAYYAPYNLFLSLSSSLRNLVFVVFFSRFNVPSLVGMIIFRIAL